ncbi:extracellular solute-binding protein [Chelatococcus sp. GCM10030263]|uniref:extracellular solute-binding protein n=1 Tax=Chelatococcus sp. GCM10030263 TaxID=3273387 RepID=UPI003616195B
MFKRSLIALTLMISPMLTAAHAADMAICYSCPEEWADWGSELRAVKKELGITVPFDAKNSGQALSQIVAEKNNPVADMANLGITFAIQAQKLGVTEAYKPAHFDDIPADLKDPDGHWFTVYSGAVGFFINKDALGDRPVPTSWKDLLKPEYRGLIGYYDPTSAFIGYIAGMAANVSLGGSLDNFDPGMNFYKELKKNEPIVVNQTSYARVLSGEIPILVDADFNALRGKYKDQANVEFVLPQEGSLPVPYVMALVKGAPHAEATKKVFDFLLSDQGQTIWAKAYLRPVRIDALPKDATDKLLPASEYARVKTLDFNKVAAAQKSFQDRYLADVR